MYFNKLYVRQITCAPLAALRLREKQSFCCSVIVMCILFNCLGASRNIFYLKTQSVPRSEHFAVSSVTRQTMYV